MLSSESKAQSKRETPSRELQVAEKERIPNSEFAKQVFKSDPSTPRGLLYPGDSNAELLWPQGDSDEAAGEVSLLPLQQVFALVQGDLKNPCPLARMPGWLKLKGHLQLANREVVAEVVGDGRDGAEGVGGDGSVQLGRPVRVHLPAHQLQVAQVSEPIRGVAIGQAGLAAGGGGGSPVVGGNRSLQEGVRGEMGNI